ncbi:hypothetical protein LCGC14_0648680 [marine sediment metagenome]|uniref:Uncharacterized protein n=1 Tax=marine sediment metagenome TaxID=412755 RepID=A0A0F9U5E8_9ZZZZ
MFEELTFIIGFLIFSVIFSYITLKYVGPPFSGIIRGLAMVGIVIHEICHILMCIITRTPIEKVSLIKKVDFKEEQGFEYYGEVLTNADRVSFLQAALIGLAPLFISFWIFFSLLEMLTTIQVDAVVFTVSVFIMISISLSAAPSIPDLSIILKAFQNDFYNSMYQIFLLLISFLSTFTIGSIFGLQGIHGLFVCLIVTGFYIVYKYGFRIVSILLHKNRFFGKKRVSNSIKVFK